jgi:hypothetical protein
MLCCIVSNNASNGGSEEKYHVSHAVFVINLLSSLAEVMSSEIK